MAMSVVWTGLVIAAVICGILTGQGAALTGAAMEGARTAAEVGLSLLGPLCLWSGVGQLLKETGVSRTLMNLLRPVLGRLFPASFRDPETAQSISANVTANLMGLGNAATPPGIAAIRRMQALTGGAEASDEMCRFVVLNTASVQLLPTTVAALRASEGAAAPFDILPAVWMTSVCSVTAGLLAASVLQKRR